MSSKKIDLVNEFTVSRIGDVSIDVDDIGPYVSFTCIIPVPGFDSSAEITETFYLNSNRHSNLQKIVSELYAEIEKSVKNGNNISNDPCASCKSDCCSHFAKSIYVTHEDVKRILKYLNKDESSSSNWFERTGKIEHTGIYGRIKGKEYCIFFNKSSQNCKIHSVKPQICRDYSPYNCSLYEPATDKVLKLRRKS